MRLLLTAATGALIDAAELYLADATVKTHVARILAKLEVRDRVQGFVAAHRSGAVTG